MPPFREGPIVVDRDFSGELLKELREVGHGHRINIVDASYDIPRGSRVVEYPGDTASALLGIVRLIPIEGEENNQVAITMMDIDPELAYDEAGDVIDHDPADMVIRSNYAIREVARKLLDEKVSYTHEGVGCGETRNEVDWSGYESVSRLGNDTRIGEKIGFYELANNPDEPHFFIRTTDDLPFACVSLVVGHSQLRSKL